MKKILACLPLVMLACNSAPANDPANAPVQRAADGLVSQSVIWTDLVNAVADGGTLTKSGGQPDVDDSSAQSAQSIDGDGWLEFTVAESSAFRFVGLSHAPGGSSAIDVSVRLQDGRGDVYENGAWAADNTVVPGDVMRVRLSNGQITVEKNDIQIWVSAIAAQPPLYASAVMISANSSVTDARMGLPAPPAPANPDLATPPANPDLGTTPPGADLATPPPADLATTTTSTDGAVAQAPAHKLCGWVMASGDVPPDQDPSYLAFANNADQLDAIHPAWWHVTSANTFATIYGEGANVILSHTTYAGQKVKLIPLVAAVDGNAPTLIHQMIADATQRAQHIQALVQLATSNSYDGLDLDYEHLPDSDRALFSQFTVEAAQALHAAGKTLSFAVGAESSASGVWDYTVLAANADQLHVMGYDYHWLGTHLGPVAPLGWLQQVATYIGTIGNTNKFILGLPNYGLAGSGGTSTWFGTSSQAAALAGAGYATTTTHMSVCPFGSQAPGRSPNAMTSMGQLYFDDLASFEEKVTLAQGAHFGGITEWTMGGEPAGFFTMVRSHFPK